MKNVLSHNTENTDITVTLIIIVIMKMWFLFIFILNIDRHRCHHHHHPSILFTNEFITLLSICIRRVSMFCTFFIIDDDNNMMTTNDDDYERWWWWTEKNTKKWNLIYINLSYTFLLFFDSFFIFFVSNTSNTCTYKKMWHENNGCWLGISRYYETLFDKYFCINRNIRV